MNLFDQTVNSSNHNKPSFGIIVTLDSLVTGNTPEISGIDRIFGYSVIVAREGGT